MKSRRQMTLDPLLKFPLKKHHREWKWESAITTVPSRIANGLFSKSLEAIDRAGFPKPRVFVDGGIPLATQSTIVSNGYALTIRNEPIQVAGSWFLAVWEMYIRNPYAEVYAIFQDDIILARNIREYMESTPLLAQDLYYFNLYTNAENSHGIPVYAQGWVRAPRKGKGALALVFTHKVLQKLLCAEHMVGRFLDASTGKFKLPRRMRSVDGGIYESMHKAGIYELVHSPSLCQHKGVKSTVEESHDNAVEAPRFAGEDFDCRTFLVINYTGEIR